MRINPELRSVVVLRHLMHLSYQDMGEILQLPEKTVKSRLYSARQALREQLQAARTESDMTDMNLALIHAEIDGELTPQSAASSRVAVLADPQTRAAREELRRYVQRSRRFADVDPPAGLATRILAALPPSHCRAASDCVAAYALALCGGRRGRARTRRGGI